MSNQERKCESCGRTNDNVKEFWRIVDLLPAFREGFKRVIREEIQKTKDREADEMARRLDRPAFSDWMKAKYRALWSEESFGPSDSK